MNASTPPVPLSVVDLMPSRAGDPYTRTMADTVAMARTAEAAGYHRYWIAEHHNSEGLASSATVVVMAEIAAATERIRVGAGGIMLPNHAPYVVAEQFGTLDAFHPGRIDLGLGRAPGTDRRTAAALQRTQAGAANFPAEVQQVREFLATPAGAPGQGAVRALPGEGSGVPVHILGSSTFGAQLAGTLGLPYVFAAHFAPAQIDEALAAYRSTFTPSAVLDTPHAIVAAGAFVAETDAEARRLFTSMQLRFVTMIRGHMQFLPPVDDIAAHWRHPQEEAMVGGMLAEAQVGSPETVVAGLEDLVRRTNADELMLMTEIYDLDARARSLELLAETWRTTGNHAARPSVQLAS